MIRVERGYLVHPVMLYRGLPPGRDQDPIQFGEPLCGVGRGVIDPRRPVCYPLGLRQASFVGDPQQVLGGAEQVQHTRVRGQ
eukprot:1000615-Alexandrium_andersonii.AAC.1